MAPDLFSTFARCAISIGLGLEFTVIILSCRNKEETHVFKLSFWGKLLSISCSDCEHCGSMVPVGRSLGHS